VPDKGRILQEVFGEEGEGAKRPELITRLLEREDRRGITVFGGGARVFRLFMYQKKGSSLKRHTTV